MHDLKDLLCAISIHALLAESDEVFPSQSALVSYFYPRSPCGERLVFMPKRYKLTTISIHALLAESDTRHSSLNYPAT